MSSFTIPPYQAQGWHIPTFGGCAPCVTDEYCQPLLFQQSTVLNEWNEFNAQATADGAFAIQPEAEACLFALFSTFFGELEYVSEPIGAQFDYGGIPDEACSLMEQLEDTVPEVPEGVTVEGLTATIEVGASPAFIVWRGLLTEGCDYRMTVLIAPNEEAEGNLTFGFAGSEPAGTLENPTAGSYIISGTALAGGQLAIGFDGFAGDVTITDLQVLNSLEIVGFLLENGEVVGSAITLLREFTEDGTLLMSFQMEIPAEHFGKCGQIYMDASCCGSNEVLSKCIKPTSDDCGTILVTWTSTRNVYGFVYASGWAQRMRIEADVRFPTWRDEDEVSYIDSAGKKNLIYSEMRKQFEMAYRAPEYIHDALALAWKHPSTFLSIDGVSGLYRLVEGESYAPNWNRASKDANIILEVEKETQNLKNKYC
jgi:hypothetical protein